MKAKGRSLEFHRQKDRAMGAAQPFVCGMDVATETGCADGYPSSKPRTWSWILRDAGKGRPERLALLMDFCANYFRETRIDYLFLEQGLRTAAAVEIGMTEETVAFLRGALGVVEACASKASIPVIRQVSAQDARKHLCGRRTFPRGTAKAEVMKQCQILGWSVETHDEADAACIWSYGCGIANPRYAVSVTPLFAGR